MLGARGRHRDGFQPRAAHPEIADRLAGGVAAIEDLDRTAHLAQGLDQTDAVRIEADLAQGDVRAFPQQGGHQRKGGGGWIGGDGDRPACELGLALQPDEPALGRLLDRERGAEMAQHQLGMVARRLGLDHAGFAGRVESGQQDRGFDLRRGDRQAVADRHRRRRADHRERQPAAVACRDRRTHLAQGRRHAFHGAAAQRCVAGEEGGDRMGRDQPHQETRAGAGIAHVDDVGRLREPADAATGDAPAPLAVLRDGRAERPHGRRRAQHVLALEQALDAGLADGERPQHQRAMRDRLVSRDAHASPDRAGGFGNQPRHDAMSLPRCRAGTVPETGLAPPRRTRRGGVH
jgi:hypothetical protein